MSSKQLKEKDVKELLFNVLDRLEKLESMVLNQKRYEEAYMLSVLVKILKMGSYPLELSNDIKRLMKVQEWLGVERIKDDIIRAILEVLALRGPMNISTLTREVRRYRGKASRRIIRNKIRELVKRGILEVIVSGREKVVRIKE